MRRRDSKQTPTLAERLSRFARRGREQAQIMWPGKDRDDVLQKVRQAEAALQVDGWLRLPVAAPEPRMPARGSRT
jgi:hypothetical protein